MQAIACREELIKPKRQNVGILTFSFSYGMAIFSHDSGGLNPLYFEGFIWKF